jgi:hypothetical protein
MTSPPNSPVVKTSQGLPKKQAVKEKARDPRAFRLISPSRTDALKRLGTVLLALDAANVIVVVAADKNANQNQQAKDQQRTDRTRRLFFDNRYVLDHNRGQPARGHGRSCKDTGTKNKRLHHNWTTPSLRQFVSSFKEARNSTQEHQFLLCCTG